MKAPKNRDWNKNDFQSSPGNIWVSFFNPPFSQSRNLGLFSQPCQTWPPGTEERGEITQTRRREAMSPSSGGPGQAPLCLCSAWRRYRMSYLCSPASTLLAERTPTPSHPQGTWQQTQPSGRYLAFPGPKRTRGEYWGKSWQAKWHKRDLGLKHVAFLPSRRWGIGSGGKVCMCVSSPLSGDRSHNRKIVWGNRVL